MPLDFDFFKHPVSPYGLKKDFTERLEWNSSDEVFLFSGDTAATWNLSDISLGYNAIFEERYATAIDEFYPITTSIHILR